MEDQDLYSVLGTKNDVSQQELRKAYLHIVAEAHPDKGGDPERFALVQKAYQILSDPTERTIYDERRLLKCDSKENGSKRNTDYNDIDGRYRHMQGSYVTVTNGVRAVVHGQHKVTPSDTSSWKRNVSSIGQDIETEDITTRIRQNKHQYSSGYLSSEEGCRILAELHLQRSQIHLQNGRLHHALFDAAEAVRLNPDWKEASESLQLIEDEINKTDIDATEDNQMEEESLSL